MIKKHDEIKDAPSFAAPETVKRLTIRTDDKRWRFFTVERTKPLKIPPGFFERHTLADKVDDVEAGFDFVYI